MKENDAIYELINRYLSGEMEEQELADFEQKIKQDTQLAKLLERERKVEVDLEAFLKVQGKSEVRATIAEMNGKYFSSSHHLCFLFHFYLGLCIHQNRSSPGYIPFELRTFFIFELSHSFKFLIDGLTIEHSRAKGCSAHCIIICNVGRRCIICF